MTGRAAVIRREGTTEVRVLAGVVLLLLAGAYLSWTRKEQKVTQETVTILDVKPSEVQGLALVTRTQTVSVERRKAVGDQPAYVWFDVGAGAKKRGFVANKTVSTLFESFAPFQAFRSLGSELTPQQLEEAKLDPPQGKLIIRLAGGDRTYDLGGRTFGARDWYVRPSGSKEVYLVASRVVSDLEFPEGRFMQRPLRGLVEKDLSAAVLEAGGKQKRFLHQNRLSEKDEYWADPKSPDVRNETIENYLAKLNGLAASAYLEPDVISGATKVLEVSWLEDDDPKERLVLYRLPDGDKHKYVAVSTISILPVEVQRTTAEQLEQDLAVVLAD